MRILIVEDDRRIATPVADDLRRQRHVVDVVADGAAALRLATSGDYDVALLDIMLPDIDGMTLCRRLRAQFPSLAILMGTARHETRDKVIALDAGADDYLVKPFDLAELSARIRALGRRATIPRPAVLRSGKLELDPRSGSARYGTTELRLTPSEFAILETLIRSTSRVFSRSVLQQKAGTADRAMGDDVIKSHVANLRRKIRAAGCRVDPIDTVYGTGYRLRDGL